MSFSSLPSEMQNLNVGQQVCAVLDTGLHDPERDLSESQKALRTAYRKALSQIADLCRQCADNKTTVAVLPHLPCVASSFQAVFSGVLSHQVMIPLSWVLGSAAYILWTFAANNRKERSTSVTVDERVETLAISAIGPIGITLTHTFPVEASHIVGSYGQTVLAAAIPLTVLLTTAALSVFSRQQTRAASNYLGSLSSPERDQLLQEVAESATNPNLVEYVNAKIHPNESWIPPQTLLMAKRASFWATPILFTTISACITVFGLYDDAHQFFQSRPYQEQTGIILDATAHHINDVRSYILEPPSDAKIEIPPICSSLSFSTDKQPPTPDTAHRAPPHRADLLPHILRTSPQTNKSP